MPRDRDGRLGACGRSLWIVLLLLVGLPAGGTLLGGLDAIDGDDVVIRQVEGASCGLCRYVPSKSPRPAAPTPRDRAIPRPALAPAPSSARSGEHRDGLSRRARAPGLS